jgi:hypothetical protein
MRLCERHDGLTCRGASLTVDRLDVRSVRRLTDACCYLGWYSTFEIVLLGRVQNGRLLVAPESSLATCDGAMRVVVAPKASAHAVAATLERGGAGDLELVSSAERATRVAAENRELAKRDPPAWMSDLPRPSYFRVKPVSIALADRVLGSSAVAGLDCDRKEDL